MTITLGDLNIYQIKYLGLIEEVDDINKTLRRRK